MTCEINVCGLRQQHWQEIPMHVSLTHALHPMYTWPPACMPRHNMGYANIDDGIPMHVVTPVPLAEQS